MEVESGNLDGCRDLHGNRMIWPFWSGFLYARKYNSRPFLIEVEKDVLLFLDLSSLLGVYC